MSTPPFRADSLASQVVGFFTNNPDERLGLDDIVAKFGYTRNNIHTLLAKATDEGYIRRYRDDEGAYIYAPGINILGMTKRPSASKGVHIDAAHKVASRQAPPPLPEIDSVVIEDNVAPPQGARGTGKKDWLPLIKKLKVGQSFALPLSARWTLGVSLTEAHKAGLGKFTRRNFKDTQQLRVWRIE